MVRMDEIRIRIVSSQMAGGEREQMNIKTQGTRRQSEDASIIESVSYTHLAAGRASPPGTSSPSTDPSPSA